MVKGSGRMTSRQRTSSQLRLQTIGDWQSNRGLVDCLDALLCDEKMTDVSFVFPIAQAREATLHAHKLILAARSSVFEAMFFGNDSKKLRYIEVTDVRCMAFKAMLKYIYTDEVMLSRDNALDVLRASQQYNIPSLTAKCCDFLHPLLSVDTLCDVMDEALTFDLRPMLLRCLVYVDEHARAVFRSENFRKCSRAVLMNILRRDSLAVDEIEVYRAAHTWSEAECRRQKIEPTAENRRKMLGNEFYLVRIPCVTQQQFADCIVKDGLLEKDEILKVFMNYSSISKDRTCPWALKPRTSGLRIAERFGHYKEASFPSTMPIAGRIGCVCDADVILVGFTMKVVRFKILFENHAIERINGVVEMTADGKSRRTVSIQQQLSPVSKRHDSNKQDIRANSVDLLLDRPLFIEKDKTTDIIFSLTLKTSTAVHESSFSECIGPQGKSPNDSFKCNDVSIKFIQPNTDITFISGLLLSQF